MTVVIDLNFYLHIAQILIGVVTIFYGRRLYWLWIGFEAFLLGERLASFALYRSTDLLRFSAAALIGLLFALLALRFRRHVLALIVTGRFLPIVLGAMALVAQASGRVRPRDRERLGSLLLLLPASPCHCVIPSPRSNSASHTVRSNAGAAAWNDVSVMAVGSVFFATVQSENALTLARVMWVIPTTCAI